MNQLVNTSEISAELLLNLFYPELKDKWIVKNKGAFYRNYSADVLRIDEEMREVSLSRDGLLKYLPQGLLTSDNELKEGDIEERNEELKKRLRILQETFVPIDSQIFRRRLQIESEITQLLNDQIDHLLKAYLGYDRTQETNPYIKTISVILPYISKLRGNIRFVRDLLDTVMGCTVRLTTGRYSEKDNTRYWLPWIKYELLIDNLSSHAFCEIKQQVKELESFINQWFMPFDAHCTLYIKQHDLPFQADGSLTLDYNTEL